MSELSEQQLQDLREYLQATPYIKYNGIVIDHIDPQQAILHVEMRHDLENPYGMAHGGMLFTMIDTTAGAAARADGRKYVTVNASVNYLRSGRSGKITAKGTLVRRGRTATVVDVAVTDEAGDLLTTGTVTMFCLDADGSGDGVRELPIADHDADAK